MADTPFNGFTSAADALVADILLAQRGSGGVNFNVGQLRDFIKNNLGFVPFIDFNANRTFTAGTPGEYALNLRNSDMIGVNGIYFNDTSNVDGEGLMWLKQGASSGSTNINDYETLRGPGDGTLLFNGGKVALEKQGANPVYFGAVDISIDTSSVEALTVQRSNDGAIFGGAVLGRKTRGTAAAPTAVMSGDVITGLYGSGWQTSGGGAWSANVAAIRFVSAENYSSVGYGTLIDYAVTAPGNTGRSVRFAMEYDTFRPNANGAITLGTTSLRWNGGFSTVALTIGSDRTIKQDIDNIDDEWLDAWGDVRWVRYKLKASVAEKGEDGARWHTGLIAQEVRDAFAARGLDGTKIGLLCHDEWEEQREPVIEYVPRKVSQIEGYEISDVLDKNGRPISRPIIREIEVVEEVDTGKTRVVAEAGKLWSLRYDECQAIEAAWQRREIARQEARITAQDALIADLTARLARLEAA